MSIMLPSSSRNLGTIPHTFLRNSTQCKPALARLATAICSHSHSSNCLQMADQHTELFHIKKSHVKWRHSRGILLKLAWPPKAGVGASGWHL